MEISRFLAGIGDGLGVACNMIADPESVLLVCSFPHSDGEWAILALDHALDAEVAGRKRLCGAPNSRYTPQVSEDSVNLRLPTSRCRGASSSNNCSRLPMAPTRAGWLLPLLTTAGARASWIFP